MSGVGIAVGGIVAGIAAPSVSAAGAVLVKVTLVLALAALLSVALRRRSASARHVVWCSALVGTLALTVCALFGPSLALEVLPSPSTGPLQSSAQLLEPAVGASQRVSPGVGAVEISAAAPPSIHRETVRSPWSLAARVSYLLGSVAVCGYFLLGMLRIARWSRTTERVPAGDPWSLALSAVTGSDPGGSHLRASRRTVDLRRSEASPVPLTWGFRRPVVIVPTDSADWTPEQRRQALLHELAHIDRFDWATQQIAHLACALFWFHPLVWVAARRMALEAERACDDGVLLAAGETPAAAHGYAEQLLRLARKSAAAPQATRAAIALARPAPLSVRIHSILEPRLRRSSMTRRQLVPTLLVLLVPMMVVGTLQLVPAPPAVAEGSAGGVAAATPGDSSVSALVGAAHRGDLPAVEALLADGARVNESDPRRTRADSTPRTALSAASSGGHLPVVALLIDAGAEIDLAPRGEATALMHAAEAGHLPVVDRLLGAGAEVDRVIYGDGTALIAASRGGHGEIVDRLLAAGADPELAVRGDGSPMIAATRSGSAEAVRALLAAGASPSRSVDGDGNPLIAAVSRGDVETVEALVASGVDVDSAVRGDGSALIRAAGRGDVRVMQALLDAGADPDRSVRGDGNPIIAAASHGHLAAVELLASHGAEIDRVVRGDENALIGASGNGHLDVVRHLVSLGADVNKSVRANGFEIRTPLSQALRGGHDEVADYLRSVGASDR